MIVGYARTSTVEQVAGLEAQQRDLNATGRPRRGSGRYAMFAPRSCPKRLSVRF